ncbi:MAG: YraN family protein [Dehalococcoidia bacterium]|nr:YraN family protein [Dehalococcoidia bacterium]
MPDQRKATGALGEKLAADYLRKQGYRIREMNHRTRLGELDIVAEDKEYLVFVEVRTRHGAAFGLPEESIRYAKSEKLISLALSYLQEHQNLPKLWRIDFVAVELTPDNKPKRIELIKNAVTGDR